MILQSNESFRLARKYIFNLCIEGDSEFMVQTLGVGTGHCIKYLLHRNIWAHVTN